MKLKLGPKVILFVLILGGLVLAFRHLVYTGFIPRPNSLKSVLPLKADEITATVLENPGDVKIIPVPTNRAVPPCVDGNTSNCIKGAVHEIEIWAWNANGGLLFATGGATGSNGKAKYIQTSKGSLMEKYGVNVHVTRQDDTNQMEADLLDTAQRLTTDPNASGVKFITDMGDGDAQFFQALNPKLAKICPDCKTEVIATIGYSRGEDGWWGPPEWKNNCASMRGGLTIGVLRDGDWNIAQKKLRQCDVINNPDDKSYDANAMNWINADSYTKAAEMMLGGGTCVDLPIKGKLGGGTKHICAQGVVTWTPGDVTIAKKLGGLVPIMTTQQSVFQMPCVLIGIRKWDQAHREDIVKMLAAIYEGGNQIKVNPAALQKMGEISASVYGEETPEYWVKYYKGVTEPDAKGNMVHLGGSSVANLAEAMQSFGLNGKPNLFAATYQTFGDIVVQQYPNLVPTYPAVSEIMDTSYVKAVAAMNVLPTNDAEKVAPSANVTTSMKTIEGQKNYTINFASGKTEILSSSYSSLNQLANDIMLTKYVTALHGYTDAAKWQGLTLDDSVQRNQQLSEDRANSVKAYLVQRGVSTPIRVYGHGQEDPVADNSVETGRAKNRRVKVVLGTVD